MRDKRERREDRLRRRMQEQRDLLDEGLTTLDLLEQVYLELGPYRRGEITQETWQKVNDFFQFNDSE